MRNPIPHWATLGWFILSLVGFNGQAAAQITSFDDFESYTFYVGPGDIGAIGGGWLGFATVYTDYPGCSSFLYQYGAFPAPNKDEGFSNISSGGTGQALNVYSDYANGDHGSGRCIESNVFRERTLSASDAGSHTFSFSTQAVAPLGGSVSTFGFVKVLDPGNSFALVYFDSVSTASAGGKSITIDIDPAFDGMLMQWGFTTQASNFEASGRLYDNAFFAPSGSTVPQPRPFDANKVPLPAWALLLMTGMLALFGSVKLKNRK